MRGSAKHVAPVLKIVPCLEPPLNHVRGCDDTHIVAEFVRICGVIVDNAPNSPEFGYATAASPRAKNRGPYDPR